MADRVGQQFGNYRLVTLLGQGGFAEVYLGQHLRLNQQAAIKVLHAHLSDIEAEHFQQEAQTIATLVHPAIIRVFDYDVQDSVPFLVMDYAPGGTLRRRYPRGSRLPLPQIVSYVKQVADALQYAHDQKFIHRDVKPENMLLGRREEVLLSDFGIATIAHSTSSLGVQGTSGTLAYMAPEQIEGHPRAASDQYALGVAAYEWLCGSRPFEGSVVEVMVQQLTMPPPPLQERVPTISAEVERVVLRALAKDPKARFASVAAFAEALERTSQLVPSPTVLLPGEPPTPGPAEATSYTTVAVAPSPPGEPPVATPSADLPVVPMQMAVVPGSPQSPGELTTLQRQAEDEMADSHKFLPPRVPPDQGVVSPPAQEAPRSEERRLVTTLFAGVVESTTLDETLDPEDMRALMGRYYAHARRVIANHGGTLEQFMGDAVLAVFGLPYAHGDDAERALATATALREAVATDTLLGGRVLLRIGIDTGEVVATSDPSGGAFPVSGEAVNVAARLQQAASVGEIVVSERAASAAQAAFLFQDARLVEVKGKRHPLRVFPLRQMRALRQVNRPALVGRQPDLRQLELLWERTLAERRPHLVSIVAPAGTGKTRLLEEFLSRLAPADGYQVAMASCPPYGQTLTYWPLRGLLGELLGGKTAHAEVADAFTRGGHTPADASRLAELVLTTLGIEREGATDREGIFAAWRLLIEALARQAPRIVVFEDLHWANESLLDLVEHLMHPRTQTALLIVATSRPELLDRRPSWGGGRRNFTALELEPLSQAQTHEFVGRLASGEGLPEATREQIVERCGGNPFFAIELVRGLVERGLGGKAALAQVLPDTVHAAVLARLDHLALQERAVLQAAAVAGRVFLLATLQAVLDTVGPAEIEAALDRLLVGDLVIPAEEGAYTFRHILIREVAYGTLTRTERIRLHGKTAAWFEAYAAHRLDEFTELIAYHYREAVRLARQAVVPVEMPFDPARAVHYLERAGELANRSGAFSEARAYLQSAIELAAGEDHVRLYERLGDVVLFFGVGDAPVNAYRQAVACWRGTAEREPLTGARLLRKLLTASLRLSGPYQAIWEGQLALLAEAQQLAERAADEDERWHVRLVPGWMLWHQPGRFTMEEVEKERTVALAAAAHFERRADWASFSEALDAYHILCLLASAWDDMLEGARRWRSAPELPATERGNAWNSLAASYLVRSDYARCIETMRQALAQRRPEESLLLFAGAVQFAFYALYLSGWWSEISELMPILKDIEEQAQQHDVCELVDLNYLCVLDIALAQEDQATATAAFAVCEGCSRDEDSRALLAAYREDDPRHLDFDTVSGGGSSWRLKFLNEHGVAARPAFITGMASSLPFGKIDATVCYIEIAEALLAADHARLEMAIDEAEAHGLIPHAARMRIVLAQRSGDRAQLDRARPVLERLGDRQFLRRLEAAAVTLSEELRTGDPGGQRKTKG